MFGQFLAGHLVLNKFQALKQRFIRMDVLLLGTGSLATISIAYYYMEANIEGANFTKIYSKSVNLLMKKSSYVILYIICYAILFVYNSLYLPEKIGGVIAVIFASLEESVILYLIIVLITLVINRLR